MTLGVRRLLAATGWLLAREHVLLTALAAPFVFLPNYAVLLLCDPVPALPGGMRDEAALQRWLVQVQHWAGSNGGWYVLADGVQLFGLAAITLLLASPARPTVGEAMRGAGRGFPAFLLLDVLAAIPVGLGLWLLVLPGLYVQARLIGALPALAAAPVGGALGALRRSLRLTRGDGFALTGATVTMFLVQWLLATPLLTADTWLRAGGHENPVLLALANAGLAFLGAVWQTTLLTLGVVVYRLRASKGT